VIENDEQVDVGVRTVIAPSHRAEQDHFDGIDRSHDLVDHPWPELLERHAVITAVLIDMVLNGYVASVRDARVPAGDDVGEWRRGWWTG
jgi:hypothetical protein